MSKPTRPETIVVSLFGRWVLDAFDQSEDPIEVRVQRVKTTIMMTKHKAESWDRIRGELREIKKKIGEV